MIRTNPRKFARLVRADLPYFTEDSHHILRAPGRHARQYEEGRSVFNDLIEFLEQVEPIGEMSWQPTLQLIACKRVAEIGATG